MYYLDEMKIELNKITEKNKILLTEEEINNVIIYAEEEYLWDNYNNCLSYTTPISSYIKYALSQNGYISGYENIL